MRIAVMRIAVMRITVMRITRCYLQQCSDQHLLEIRFQSYGRFVNPGANFVKLRPSGLELACSKSLLTPFSIKVT